MTTTTTTSHVPAPRPAPDDQGRTFTLADLTTANLLACTRLAVAMRMEGSSWADVGRELGLDQSNAHRRWAKVAGDLDVAIVRTEDGAVLEHVASGLRWDPRQQTPLQAAYRDQVVAHYLVQRAAVEMGLAR